MTRRAQAKQQRRDAARHRLAVRFTRRLHRLGLAWAKSEARWFDAQPMLGADAQWRGPGFYYIHGPLKGWRHLGRNDIAARTKLFRLWVEHGPETMKPDPKVLGWILQAGVVAFQAVRAGAKGKR